MNEVKVRSSKLLKIVEKNRTNHIKEHKQAVKDYRVAMVGILKDKLSDAKKGKDVDHDIELTRPFNNESEYDRIINMLKLTIEKTVKLSHGEFAQYVQDDWQWKRQFSASNSVLRTTAMSYDE